MEGLFFPAMKRVRVCVDREESVGWRRNVFEEKRVNVRKRVLEERRGTESACEILLPFEDSPPGGLIRTDNFCTVIVGMKVVGRVMDGKGGGSVDGGRERRRG